MHLQILEDYIAELLEARIENRHEFVETSSVISRLMDIIIEEERRIPDFVIDGDRLDGGEEDFFWPDDVFDDDIEGEFNADEIPLDRDRSSLVDPGFIFPIGGGYFLSIGGRKKDQTMRSMRWVTIVLTVAIVGFVVGLMAAP